MSRQKIKLLALCGFLIFLQTAQANGLSQLSDEELSNIEGQALFNLNKTDNSSQGLSFYRLGMEAEIALNANIKKLQLGCGGSKGAGCDIDIDNVALTGITTSNAQGAGATTDFILNNPFVEFAISNTNQASTRSIEGFRLGALSALGMMSLGSNENTSTLTDDTGINSLSGDIGVRVTNANINGINITLIGTANARVNDYSGTIIADRSTSFSLTGLKATARLMLGGFIPVPIDLQLTANMNNIPFNTAHRLQVSDVNGNPTSGAYLSLQKKDINWQNIATGQWNNIAAKKGWWLSVPDTQFANLTMDGSGVRLSALDAIGGILGATVDIPAMDLGQRPVNNCYGTLKFC
ncbi:hypothetical protein RFI02_09895 [Acinetobacter sichuanensis]|uniref:hypothetical protein n=1 Tax=Acinetobacter sichuanensis TaxID=2136183 RepID=UPI00280DFC2D|nr:hypothetical protein [Acinetobacter sichuanensis]MDQ9021416.1 hypothetical protein [Acinetobacter sichuanensis]